MFRRDWFYDPDHRPKLETSDVPKCEWACYWDKAGTAGGGAYTAGVLMAYSERTSMAYIRDVVRGQWAAAEREREIEATVALWAQWVGGPLAFTVYVEQEPGSGGKDSVADTKRRLAGYRVKADLPGQRGSKDVRAEPLATAAEVGQVRIVKGEWNEAFLREIEYFGPGAAYKDQVDAAAGCYNNLTTRTRLAVHAGPVSLTRRSPWKL
jgi:predicted phage terminase large subunit-like protein